MQQPLSPALLRARLGLLELATAPVGFALALALSALIARETNPGIWISAAAGVVAFPFTRLVGVPALAAPILVAVAIALAHWGAPDDSRNMLSFGILPAIAGGLATEALSRALHLRDKIETSSPPEPS